VALDRGLRVIDQLLLQPLPWAVLHAVHPVQRQPARRHRGPAYPARDRTNLHCPCFNIGHTFDSPSLRAATILHESWHHWQYEHTFDPSHPLCDNGSECDWYYFHGVGRFDFGVMNTWDTNPQHFAFHSPYQIMVEFLGDLSELSTAETPAVVRQVARTAGNSVLIQKFKNAVRYRIGDPRPW
jgi:hypothetical protein